MSFKLLDVQHRHCVFTIARELRPFFLQDRSLLNCLFSSVHSVIIRMFHKENQSELFTPGFICVLHTFGRDLKWNPHIHCLISEGGIGKSLRWRHKKHFNYKLLRDSFQTALLNELHKRLGDSFKKVKSSIYADHKNGFYVRAMPNKCNPNHVIKYIGRYLGRPAIATSRIDSYDGDSVTFHYNRHEDNKLITETIPALDFISRLTQTSVYKGYKRDKIEMRGDRAEMSDFPLYLNTVAGGLDCRNQAIGGFSFVVKIYALPVVKIIGQFLYLLG